MYFEDDSEMLPVWHELDTWNKLWGEIMKVQMFFQFQ